MDAHIRREGNIVVSLNNFGAATMLEEEEHIILDRLVFRNNARVQVRKAIVPPHNYRAEFSEGCDGEGSKFEYDEEEYNIDSLEDD